MLQLMVTNPSSSHALHPSMAVPCALVSVKVTYFIPSLRWINR